MIETELGDRATRPAQRFKRLDRILNKLMRFPHMRLSQMEDIGGCRAVFETLEDLYAVEALCGVAGHTPESTITSRIQRPTAIEHFTSSKRDGRFIEVQLRTHRQHQWAELVEFWAGSTGYGLKDGRGPRDLRTYFKMAALRLALEDQGEPPDAALEKEFATLRKTVRHYFASPRKS